jgi:very-short-patch-repair endonuclease
MLAVGADRIEIDGFHHFGDPEAYRRDRRKDLLLQTQGLLVIRAPAEDVMRVLRPAIAEVCRALTYRRGDAP